MGIEQLKDKKINELSGNDIARKILAHIQGLKDQQEQIDQIEQRQKNLESEVQEIKELLQTKEIQNKPEKKPIFQRKDKKQVAEFKRLIGKRSKQGEGISWRDVKDIFDVKKTQAYDILAEIERTYDWIGELDRHPRNILVHKKNFLVHYIDKWYSGVRNEKKRQEGNGDLTDLTWRQLLDLLETNIMKAEKKERVELLKELQDSFLED